MAAQQNQIYLGKENFIPLQGQPSLASQRYECCLL